MIRIIIFLITNLGVMLVFGLVLYLIGIQLPNINQLLLISCLLGFSGSLLSLLLSKSIALYSVGGKIINQANNNVEHWLLNIVHNQIQKVNINMPQVAIYDAYQMNAFATGIHRNNSLIAVSSGLLQNMHHDEIEAVIAHEVSHIVNGDMLTMTLIQGVINTFVIFISRIIAQFISSYFIMQDKNNSNNISEESIYFFISTILEMIFGILASIIVFWFSRHREFYADAGSAKLVGKNKMIAALERLKTSYEVQEANHIISFCIHGHKNIKFSELFMSHPPLEIRIEALRMGTYLK